MARRINPQTTQRTEPFFIQILQSRSNKRWPASVTKTLRVVRCSKRTPRRSSSCRIKWLSADGVTWSRDAAARKLRCSAIAMKAVRLARSERSILYNHLPGFFMVIGIGEASRARRRRRTFVRSRVPLRPPGANAVTRRWPSGEREPRHSRVLLRTRFDGRTSITSHSTRNSSPGRTGRGQRHSSRPAPTMPPAGLSSVSTSSRIVTAAVC